MLAVFALSSSPPCFPQFVSNSAASQAQAIQQPLAVVTPLAVKPPTHTRPRHAAAAARLWMASADDDVDMPDYFLPVRGARASCCAPGCAPPPDADGGGGDGGGGDGAGADRVITCCSGFSRVSSSLRFSITSPESASIEQVDDGMLPLASQ